MNIIVCVDDDYGMMFNNRRQSRDEAVLKDILSLVGDKRLLLSEYSAKLFLSVDCNMHISKDFLLDGKDGDFCFIEDVPLPQTCNKVVLYRWNRKYPSDCKFNSRLLDSKILIESVDFSGNSHQKITREIYE